MSRRYDGTLFAVVRVDEPAVELTSATLRNSVTVKEIVRTQSEAETEVDRLNRLNADKGCVYLWQVTRLVENDESRRCRALLSAQRALVGEITPDIRAIAVDVSEREIVLRVYTVARPSDGMWENLDSAVVTQMIADLPGQPGDPEIRLELRPSEEPAPLPVQGILVYSRAEREAAG